MPLQTAMIPAQDNAKNYRNALVLSSCAFPGAGQFLQGKYIHGLVFVSLFAVPFVFFLVSSVKLINEYLKVYPDLGAIRELFPLWIPVGKYFMMTGVVWAISLMDIYIRHKIGKTE